MPPPPPGPVQPKPHKPQQQGKGQGQGKRPWVKRKRGADLSPMERLQHTTTKEIGRELKKVKAFLLQRLVKRCRKLRGQAEGGSSKATGRGKGEEDGGDSSGSSSSDEGDEDAAGKGQGEDSPAVKACLEEIKAVKALTAEVVAPVCLRRLGVAYTGSEHAGLSEAAAAPGVLKQALEHPRMAALLQSFDERVTDLRRGGDGKKPKQADGNNNKKKRPRGGNDDEEGDGDGEGAAPTKLARVRAKATAAYEGSSVFLDSLSGYVPQRSLHHHRGRDLDVEDEDGIGGDDGMDVYGYREFGASAQRKNRQGQRARRAKMEAIKAAMEGRRRGGPSSNWRGERRGGGDGPGAQGGRGGGGGGGRGGGGAGGWGGMGGRGEERGRGGPRPPSAASSGPAFGGDRRGGAKPQQQAPLPPPPPSASGGGRGAAAAPAAPAESLHPSWAAKQAQRAKEGGGGLGAFQGKKITFASEDD